jgi:hypothetical protein
MLKTNFESADGLDKCLYTTCSEFVFFLYRTCKSMNNLSSYCGLTDSRMRASDTDLPVTPNCREKYLQKKLCRYFFSQGNCHQIRIEGKILFISSWKNRMNNL